MDESAENVLIDPRGGRHSITRNRSLPGWGRVERGPLVEFLASPGSHDVEILGRSLYRRRAGLIDVTPMLMRQAGAFAIGSAFLHWVVVRIFTAYLRVDTSAWLKGIVVSLAVAIPVVVDRLGENPQSAVDILAMSVVSAYWSAWR